jgi:anti-sigma regulatory factor (Ser/Thr protein kinase)
MEARARVRLPATLESLEGFRTLVSSYARGHGLDPGAVSAIELALEEALVNIARYAYRGEPGEVEVGCRAEGDRLLLDILDWGEPFDPLAAPEPERTGGIEARQVGGLGIHLMKRVMDEVRYRREGNCNHLTLVKVRWVSPSPSAGRGGTKQRGNV